MSFVQKLVINFLPQSWSDAIKRESQQWLLRCPECDSVSSVWEHGGIRFKAASSNKSVRAWCGHCEKMRMMPLEYGDAE